MPRLSGHGIGSHEPPARPGPPPAGLHLPSLRLAHAAAGGVREPLAQVQMQGDEPVITVLLPWPNKILSPNDRSDRRSKANYVRAARAEGKIETLAQAPQAQLPSKARLSITLTFCPPIGYPYDLDNLIGRMKSPTDGVADALQFNDRQIVERHEYWGEPYPGGRVELRLEVL